MHSVLEVTPPQLCCQAESSIASDEPCFSHLFFLSLWSGSQLLGLLELKTALAQTHGQEASTAPVELKAIHTATGCAGDSDMA